MFNASESTDMIFHVPFSKYFLPELYVAGDPINLSNFVKYLGIHLNQSLTDDDDIMRQVKFLYTAGNKLQSDFLKYSVSVENTLFVLTVLVFMFLNCRVILNRKALEDYW